jgi:hypothetical protein
MEVLYVHPQTLRLFRGDSMSRLERKLPITRVRRRLSAMTGRHPTQTTLPADDLKPAWRVACVAYRSVRQAGHLDQPAWLAARAAIQSLRPDLDEDAAGQAGVGRAQRKTRSSWRGVTPRSRCASCSSARTARICARRRAYLSAQVTVTLASRVSVPRSIGTACGLTARVITIGRGGSLPPSTIVSTSPTSAPAAVA